MTRLKQLRLEKGYTQIKIQMMTGIDQSDYSKLENGKSARHGDYNFATLADAFDAAAKRLKKLIYENEKELLK